VALIAFDGFDNYGDWNFGFGGDNTFTQRAGVLQWSDNDPGVHWPNVVSPPSSANGGGCLEIPANGSWVLGTLAVERGELFIQFGLLMPPAGTPAQTTTVGLLDLSAGVAQAQVVFDTVANSVSIFNSVGALLTTTGPRAFDGANWSQVEIAVVIAPSLGSIAVALDGSLVLQYVGDTQQTANAWINGVRLEADGGNGNAFIDDFCASDVAVAPGLYPCNAWMGALRVQTLFPIANGAVSWTPQALTNWQEVACWPGHFEETTHYNATATPGTSDAFVPQPLAGGVPQYIVAVQIVGAYWEQAATGGTVTQFLLIGGTRYWGAANALTTTYEFFQDLFPLNPATGVAWTVADINGLQIGYQSGGTGTVLAGQVALEVLASDLTSWSPGMATYPVYPALPGLGFSVVKRPAFYTASAKSGSGWQVRVSYAQAPTWEWELTYDLLADQSAASDLKTLLGFFLGMGGDLAPFLFFDPDDNSVTGQPLGTTDGATTIWTLVRSFGSGQTGTEPVGYVNTAQAVNVYLAGVLQNPLNYDVLTTTPVSQQIRFHAAPAAGLAITADFGYYYFVHFKDATNDFEKFMNQLWSLKKVTLESLRG
jgi:hypothetical protein